MFALPICFLVALSLVAGESDDWKKRLLPPTDENGGPATQSRETPEPTSRALPTRILTQTTVSFSLPIFTVNVLTPAPPTTLAPRASLAPTATLTAPTTTSVARTGASSTAATSAAATSAAATSADTAATAAAATTSLRRVAGEEKTGLPVGEATTVSGGDAENNGGNNGKDKSLDNVAIGLIAGGVALALLAAILVAVALLRKRAAAAVAHEPVAVSDEPPAFARENTVESLYGAPPAVAAMSEQYGPAPSISSNGQYGMAPPLTQ